MTGIFNDAKHITTTLNGAEKGDDLSVYIEDTKEGHYRGEVIAVDDEPNTGDVKVTIDDGELTHEVYSRYVGPDDGSHSLSDSDDYEVFAAAGMEYDVTALATRDNVEAPDLTLDGLEAEDADEIAEAFEAELSSAQRAMTELQAMRQAFNSVLESRMTLAEAEEKMVDVQMDSGGRLELDK